MFSSKYFEVYPDRHRFEENRRLQEPKRYNNEFESKKILPENYSYLLSVHVLKWFKTINNWINVIKFISKRLIRKKKCISQKMFVKLLQFIYIGFLIVWLWKLPLKIGTPLPKYTQAGAIIYHEYHVRIWFSALAGKKTNICCNSKFTIT